MNFNNDTSLNEAFQVALKGYQKAYCPYSKFQVGAALKIVGNPNIIAGSNIENVSFSATICAERTAFCSAFSQINKDKLKFEFMIVLSNEEVPVTPCGVCRQFMVELCKPDFPLYLANLKGIQTKVLLSELFPQPFDAFAS